MKKTYYIIDGNSFIYRAFFAVPKFTTRDGQVINALFGFTKMLFKLLKQNNTANVIVAFDTGKETFRSELYKEYKAHWEAMPDELYSQIPLIHELVSILNLPTLALPGVEADDAIASFVHIHPNDTHYIVTGDKDMMQLVNDHIFIYDTMKDKVYDADGVKEKMGVSPERIQDLLGLMGDSSDNIPGVKGIGPKTAAKLLTDFSSVEEVLDRAEEIGGSVGKKLIECREMALLSKQLATVRTNIDISHISLEVTPPQSKSILEFCTKYEFFSLKKDIEDIFGSIDTQPESSPKTDLPTKIKEEPASMEILQDWLTSEVDLLCQNDKIIVQYKDKYMNIPLHEPFLHQLREWIDDSPKGTILGIKELSFLVRSSNSSKTQLDIFSL